MNNVKQPFGEVIYRSTRKQALEDGLQVDVTETAKEAGIKFPTFVTRTVYDSFVSVPKGVSCQDEAGRLWDIVSMLRFAILNSNGADRVTVELSVRNDNKTPLLVRLLAVCGPLDIDDFRPSVTVMMPDED